MIDALFASVIKRPYVFCFLAAYLFLAIRLWGIKKTFIWLVSGYAIAWLSEYSSINNGFPYGEYHYIYKNMPGELMIFGVPFFDSLSYPFLIFAGFTTASLILNKGRLIFTIDSFSKAIKYILLGAFLTTILDIIIDPVAKLGSQWFLGEIYYYASDGWYFNVPMSNFAGWFLVSAAVVAFNVIVWKLTSSPVEKISSGFKYLYPSFYIAIGLFNICVTFWIGAIALGISSSVILLLIVMWVVYSTKAK